MKNKIYISIGVIIVVLAGAFFYYQNGGIKEGIVIDSPKSGSVVVSPAKITGYVNGGGWIGFEGQVGTVDLVNNNGNVLATAVLTAKTDWTKPPVRFEANLEFISTIEENGFLVFRNENPSGLPEKSKEFKMPVLISGLGAETIKLYAYFNNSVLDTEYSCNKVFGVLREVPKTMGPARAALEELFKGPTDKEKSEGYYTNINPGVAIQSLSIENGTAKADFNDQLEAGVGGSCKVSAIRAQIIQTLRQFPTVEEVVISINGRTEDILQP